MEEVELGSRFELATEPHEGQMTYQPRRVRVTNTGADWTFRMTATCQPGTYCCEGGLRIASRALVTSSWAFGFCASVKTANAAVNVSSSF